MDEITERLRQCFREVFEGFTDEQIESAVRGEAAEWDSLASLTLLSVVEDEFGLQLDDDLAAGLATFAAWRGAVRGSLAG